MKYAVIGKGVSGLAAYRLLINKGARATLFDDRESTLSFIDIASFDSVVLSPGVSKSHPAVSSKIPILSELDIASRYLNCKPKIIGITGTNGKTTTTALLGAILGLYSKNIFIGGNFGLPLSSIILNNICPEFIILELSSYQLENIKELKLDIAISLNLSLDHLDRYKCPNDYYFIKKTIFSLLRDDGRGINMPYGRSFLTPFLGVHNAKSVYAAVLAAHLLNIPRSIIESAILNFKGLPHRFEVLGVKNNITWVNDSKSTNINSTIRAVDNFSGRLHLIVGGRGKGANYAKLVKFAKSRVKKVYAIGEETERLFQAFGKKAARVFTLKNAFSICNDAALPGDCVLLSPACSSYDQFRNFEHRGEVFRELFNEL